MLLSVNGRALHRDYVTHHASELSRSQVPIRTSRANGNVHDNVVGFGNFRSMSAQVFLFAGKETVCVCVCVCILYIYIYYMYCYLYIVCDSV